MKTIDLQYWVGDTVIIRAIDKEATVEFINIVGDGVSYCVIYNVKWCHEGEFHTSTFYDRELRLAEGRKKLSPGFCFPHDRED